MNKKTYDKIKNDLILIKCVLTGNYIKEYYDLEPYKDNLKVLFDDNLSVLSKDNQQNAQLVLFCYMNSKIVLLTFPHKIRFFWKAQVRKIFSAKIFNEIYLEKKDSAPDCLQAQNLFIFEFYFDLHFKIRIMTLLLGKAS